MTGDDETVGKRILDSRTAKDLSQTKLAQLTGVSTAAIWQWETRGKVPRPRTLHKVASALDVSPDYLLTGKMSAKRPPKAAREAVPEAIVEDGAAIAAAIERESSIAQQVERLKATIAGVSGVNAAQIVIEIKISS